MATAVAKAQVGGTDPPAHDARLEPLSLPAASSSVHLTYPSEATDAEIFGVDAGSFITVRAETEALPTESVARIEPNALVWGDNFRAALKLLESHAGKVSLVYMDPPYCTGMDFQSRSQRHAYSDQLAPAQYGAAVARVNFTLFSDASFYEGHEAELAAFFR